MSTYSNYDFIVIGAGIVGSATAYYLAKNGHRTLLLEQFNLPHTRGSSHGQSRIIRKAYVQDYYAQMMQEAFNLWQELENETGINLYKKLGLLCFGANKNPTIIQTRDALRKTGAEHKMLSGSEVKKEFPMFNMPDDYIAVFDPIGGMLRADKCIIAYQTMLKHYRGTIHEAAKVTDIFPGDTVTIFTTKGNYSCKNLVITAGPWTTDLVKPLGLNLPLKVHRASVHYWKEKIAGSFDTNKAPCFSLASGRAPLVALYGVPSGEYHNFVKPVRIAVCYWKEKFPEEKDPGSFAGGSGAPAFIGSLRLVDEKSLDYYGLPDEEYPGLVKVCKHDGPEIHPDRRDFVVGDIAKKDLKILQQFVRKHFPGLEEEPSLQETCIYTMTPDEDFILDRHPTWQNIIIGAGFSGHGFKLAPVAGKILGELATKQPPTYDLSPFRINRFSNIRYNAKL